jgi:hypothetical protein
MATKQAGSAVKEGKQFTEVVTATGSGRKVKITCGDTSKKSFAPSAGLGEDLNLL